jgi:hypothetical protein
LSWHKQHLLVASLTQTQHLLVASLTQTPHLRAAALTQKQHLLVAPATIMQSRQWGSLAAHRSQWTRFTLVLTQQEMHPPLRTFQLCKKAGCTYAQSSLTLSTHQSLQTFRLLNCVPRHLWPTPSNAPIWVSAGNTAHCQYSLPILDP